MKSRLRTHLTWLSLLVKSEIIPDFSRSESRYPELASLCCSIISDTLADISQDKWGWENFFLPTLKDHIEVEINQFLVWFWFPIVGCIRLRHPTNDPKCHDMHKVKPQQCTLGVYTIGNDIRQWWRNVMWGCVSLWNLNPLYNFLYFKIQGHIFIMPDYWVLLFHTN